MIATSINILTIAASNYSMYRAGLTKTNVFIGSLGVITGLGFASINKNPRDQSDLETSMYGATGAAMFCGTRWVFKNKEFFIKNGKQMASLLIRYRELGPEMRGCVA